MYLGDGLVFKEDNKQTNYLRDFIIGDDLDESQLTDPTPVKKEDTSKEIKYSSTRNDSFELDNESRSMHR